MKHHDEELAQIRRMPLAQVTTELARARVKLSEIDDICNNAAPAPDGEIAAIQKVLAGR